MSKEQEDAAIGKLMRDMRDAKTKMTALISRGQEYGLALFYFATTLRDDPSHSFIEGQLIPMGMMGPGHVPIERKYFNADEIGKITDEIRSTEKQIQNMERQLIQAGFKL